MARKTKGFTIVEALFVLALGGLILLIVLEAIPALTRSGHNNQRKQDVQAILGAISHYELNNSGGLPGSGSKFLQYTKLSFFDPTSVNYFSVLSACSGDGTICVYAFPDAAHSPSIIPGNNSDTAEIFNYQKCDTNGGSTSAAAGYNDVVALYSIETGGGNVASQCQQL